ncbi:MAG TPA: energy transducer TonB [Candidatus Angelobacter sp.]|nr:energy transducer TonB [Candidatus Angelobacter sp.]
MFASCLFLAFTASLSQQPDTEEPIFPITAKGIKPPKATFTPEPEIPKDALKGKSTRALVTGYVAIDGRYHNGKILRSSGEPTLDTNALEAVKKWKFHPCTREGKAVNCEMIIEVTFKLKGDHK